MARRAQKRRFGSPVSVHEERARLGFQNARRAVDTAIERIEDGDCTGALDSLIGVGALYGAADANLHSGAPLDAVISPSTKKELKNRIGRAQGLFARKCIRQRGED